MLKIKKKKMNSVQTNHVLSDQSGFQTIETYKSIRTSIMFSLPRMEGGKVVGITSAVPGEGKSTTAINLGIVFAQMGVKVILLDCDMRKPAMHRNLGIELGEGMSNLICGFTTLDKAIRKEVKPGLDCITAGEIPPNSAEVLSSQAFTDIIAQLKEKYDYILIDTPPVTVVTDAEIISKHCTGMIIVVKKDSTVYDALDETVARLNKIQVKIIGFIMNFSDSKSGRYGYYKHSYRYKYKNYRYELSDLQEGESIQKENK